MMKATIVVLTFNAEEFIGELLDGCLRQTPPFEYEILVIDSGSRDKTLEMVQGHGERVRLHEIPNSEFGHGRTRNLAAKLARGEFVVYLTHDAVPATEHWLEEVVRPFELNERVAAVFGKQIPRPDCCPTVKRDVIGLFRTFGPDHFTMVQQANPLIADQASRDAIRFYSDVNSASRRDFLLNTIPYQEIDYAEDQAFGRDVIAAGYIKVYAPLAAVIHSHSYPPVKYLRRMYDEMVGLKKATGVTLDTSLRFHTAWIAKATLKDWAFIARDPAYRLRTKLKYVVQAPVYNVFRRLAIRLANRRQVPGWAHSLLALEARSRKQAR